MKKPHQEQLLQDLYAQNKKQVALPSDVKTKILNHAKNSRYPFAFLMKWQTICAVFFVGWLWFDNSRTEIPTYTVTQGYTEDNQLVYYHQVNYQSLEQNQTSKMHSVKLTENPQYIAYMESLTQLDSSNKLSGIVKQLDNEVLVDICQLGLVRLSPSVLDNLNVPTEIAKLKVGQQILLMADNKGHFFAIESNTNAEHCAE